MLNRNRFLIEHADIVLVVYNGKPQSGTGATVRYAQQPGRKVIVINPFMEAHKAHRQDVISVYQKAIKIKKFPKVQNRSYRNLFRCVNILELV